ncbi:MFS transporter [Blastococcus jejuensis]|uniref:MFS transporter n=1 Tax=Blastococcus jejuensis TaxID=351224 RepID=A0ABP6PFZ7_9ACTN
MPRFLGRERTGRLGPVSAESPPAAVAHPLGDPQFRWFFAGRLVSMTGSSMVWVALTFAILEASDRTSDLSIVVASYTVPLALFQIFGGAAADRFSRSAVLVGSHLGSAVTQGISAVLLLTGHYQLVVLAGLAALNGTMQALSGPALIGIVPDLVDRGLIQRANALLGATRNATRIVGPALAGLIVAGAGGGWAVAVDAVCYLLAAACLGGLRLPAPVRAAGASMLRDLREGWGAFRSRTWVWVGSSSFAVINFVQAGVWGVLGPVLAEDTIGAAAWGLVLSGTAAGFLVSSVIMYRVTFTRLLGVGQAFLVLGALPLVLLGLGVPTPVLVAGAFLGGAGTGVYGIAYETSFQEHIPGEALSRVASIDTTASLVTVPLGQLAVIPVAAAFGDSQVAVVGGVAFALVAAGMLAVRPIRTLRHGE